MSIVHFTYWLKIIFMIYYGVSRHCAVATYRKAVIKPILSKSEWHSVLQAIQLCKFRGTILPTCSFAVGQEPLKVSGGAFFPLVMYIVFLNTP